MPTTRETLTLLGLEMINQALANILYCTLGNVRKQSVMMWCTEKRKECLVRCLTPENALIFLNIQSCILRIKILIQEIQIQSQGSFLGNGTNLI